MKRNTKVSTAVIRRLPRYYRQLCELQEAGVERISSSGLGRSIGLTASHDPAGPVLLRRVRTAGLRL